MSYELKTAGLDQVLKSISSGGALDTIQSFYSGGHTYTHVLTTKRGTQYRVSKQVMKSVAQAEKLIKCA